VGLPEAFTAAELDWRDGDVHRVNEVGVEELADGCDAATQTHVLAACGLLRSPQGLAGVALRKWKVVSDKVNDGRS